MNDHTTDLGRDPRQQYELRTEISGASLLELSTGWAAWGLRRLHKSSVFQCLWPVIRRRPTKRILIAFLVLMPLKSYGQWLQVSPTSMSLWGHSPRVAKISLGYRSVELVYLYGFKSMYDHQGAAFGGEYFGVFWNPLTVEKGPLKISGGAGYFFRKYPTVNGTHLNFSLKLSFRLSENLRVQYGHISNGFGIFNSVNPGVDNIGLVIAL